MTVSPPFTPLPWPLPSSPSHPPHTTTTTVFTIFVPFSDDDDMRYEGFKSAGIVSGSFDSSFFIKIGDNVVARSSALRSFLGMATNLGFLVLILSVIFLCEAVIFHPISESHRFAALKLFTPLHAWIFWKVARDPRPVMREAYNMFRDCGDPEKRQLRQLQTQYDMLSGQASTLIQGRRAQVAATSSVLKNTNVGLTDTVNQTRNAARLVASAIAVGLGALTHTLGTFVPVIGASGFATAASGFVTAIGTVVGSFR